MVAARRASIYNMKKILKKFLFLLKLPSFLANWAVTFLQHITREFITIYSTLCGRTQIGSRFTDFLPHTQTAIGSVKRYDRTSAAGDNEKQS